MIFCHSQIGVVEIIIVKNFGYMLIYGKNIIKMPIQGCPDGKVSRIGAFAKIGNILPLKMRCFLIKGIFLQFRIIPGPVMERAIPAGDFFCYNRRE